MPAPRGGAEQPVTSRWSSRSRPRSVPDVTIRGVLFDFSGTLFQLDYESACLAGLAEHTGGDGTGPHAEEHVELMRRLTAPLVPSAYLPEGRRADWQRRDLDPALHRD